VVPSEFINRRFTQPLLGLLRHGATPEKIAVTLAVGFVLGVFPALGTTTILCVSVALLFRLNVPAIQLTNMAAYPLQVLLLIPFVRLGEKLFGVPPGTLSLGQVASMIQANAWNAIQTLWVATMHAIVAWFAVGVPMGVALYFVFAAMLRGLLARRSSVIGRETPPDEHSRSRSVDAVERIL
jgi:uncharacterized protein (DUF2062 family)